MGVPGPDSHLEKVMRSLMITEARSMCDEVVERLKEWYQAPQMEFRA
jgi:hypothetical protein